MSDVAFLDAERALLEHYLPGLDGRLASAELDRLERPGSPAIGWFREAGGPALFVPAEFSGRGVGLREGVRVQRAIASRAPSLAVATTMHHFSVASLAGWDEQEAGLEWLLVEAIARNGLLVASGAAEGTPGSGILRPAMTARKVDGGVRLDGSKKPCSLSASMDLLFATVRVTADPDAGGEQHVIAVVPADSPGLSTRPFWRTGILAGAESDEVVLADVFVPDRLLSGIGPPGATTDALRRSLISFELLISASYLGVAAALVERALSCVRGTTGKLARMAVALEGPTFTLDGVAARVEDGTDPALLLGPALVARFAAQDAAAELAAAAVEALGGGAFLGSPEIAYLLAASRCLAFHPPSREAGDTALVNYLRGAAVAVE